MILYLTLLFQFALFIRKYVISIFKRKPKLAKTAVTTYPSRSLEFTPFVTYNSGVRNVLLSNYVVVFFYICSGLRCTLRCPRENDVSFVFTPMCFEEVSCFIYVICIYLRLLVFNTISISYDVRVVF